MSRVIGLIEIDTVGDSDFIASDDRTLDFLFAGLCGDTSDATTAVSPRPLGHRCLPPCPAVCHVTRVEANLESLFDELDAQTAQLVSRLVAARQHESE